MIEKVQINQVTDGGTVVIHPETSSSSVLHEGGTLDKVITIDGQNKQNFNFIPNEVVQEGLVGLVLESTNQFDTKINMNNNFTCQIELNHKKATGNILLFGNVVKYSGFLVYISPDRKLSFQYSDLTTKFYDIYLEYGINKIVVKREKEEIIIRVNDSFVVTEKISGKILPSSKTLRLFLNDSSMGSIASCVCYGRDINSQEIQHNFSVLNNPQSLSALETTDSTGTKVKHLFHSDSQVVSMRDERTLNEFANEVLDWEEKTADVTGNIVANNCKRAWLKNFSIEGRTVKNEISGKKIGLVYTNDGYLQIPDDSTYSYDNIAAIEPNLQYTLIFFVRNNNKEESLNVYLNANTIARCFTDISIKGGENGIFVFNRNSLTGDRTEIVGHFLCGGIEIGLVILKGTYTKEQLSYIKSPFYGLSSTQAIISNNGMKSVFQRVNEEGIKEVIELSKVGDVADTLTLNADGSGTLVNSSLRINLGDLTFNGPDTSSTNTIRSSADISHLGIKPSSRGLCDIFNVITSGTSTNDTQNICVVGTNIFVRILRSNLNGVTLNDFNKYINDNKPVAVLESSTSTTINIPKELMPTIATQQTNILSVDSPVQPSSFKATAPVDKVGILEKELARIASIVDTPKNIALLDNYVEDEYNKNQKEEGVM